MGKTIKKVGKSKEEDEEEVKKVAPKKKLRVKKQIAKKIVAPKHYSTLYTHDGGDVAKYRHNVGSAKREEIDPILEEIANENTRINLTHSIFQLASASNNKRGGGGQITSRHFENAALSSPYLCTPVV
jgi:predicted alpha/beta superfamily hydrolase